ncbi:MurR/RpiR family transcriptional regulator [Brachybacterium nesterenkovii]|uniref:MurR/RpiR family transcriptional regulator n=1 Tax=Brachybacterium nesterenkovii TaxID=47847 RepID=UPI00321955B8
METTERTPTSRTLLADVRAMLPDLRPSERRIAEDLLADPRMFASSSGAQIAERVSTSTTTVIRFTHRLGYQRLRDLRHDLTEQAVREDLAAVGARPVASDIAAGDGLGAVVAKVATDESLSISDTAEVLSLDELERAVAAIRAATRVDVYGVGASAIVAVDLQRKLARIGRVALEWPESHAAWTAAAVLDASAVAVAVSHSGGTSETVEFLRLARESGAVTIAITNHDRSPLAAMADIVLRTAARESALRSGALGSRIAQLMVVDCLFVGVAQSDFERSVSAVQKTYSAVGPRAYGD